MEEGKEFKLSNHWTIKVYKDERGVVQLEIVGNDGSGVTINNQSTELKFSLKNLYQYKGINHPGGWFV